MSTGLLNTLSNNDGTLLSGYEHLRQSIEDILFTPLGSRIMLPDYGSKVFTFIDMPINRETLIDLYSEVIQALVKWEPRIRPTRVQVSEISGGRVSFDLSFVYLPDGKEETIRFSSY